MNKLEWKDNKVTLHRIEVVRRPIGKLTDQGWTVHARGPDDALRAVAIDEADTDSRAHQLALAALALYDESIPHELVKIVNENAREYAAGLSKKEQKR